MTTTLKRRSQVRRWLKPIATILKHLHTHPRLKFSTIVDPHATYNFADRKLNVPIPGGIDYLDVPPRAIHEGTHAYGASFDHAQAFDIIVERWLENDANFVIYCIDKYNRAHFMRIDGDWLAPEYRTYSPVYDWCACEHCPVAAAIVYTLPK